MIGDVHSSPLPTSRDNPTLGDGLETAIGTGSGVNIHKTSSASGIRQVATVSAYVGSVVTV
jgi:hypothetical protein